MSEFDAGEYKFLLFDGTTSSFTDYSNIPLTLDVRSVLTFRSAFMDDDGETHTTDIHTAFNEVIGERFSLWVSKCKENHRALGRGSFDVIVFNGTSSEVADVTFTLERILALQEKDSTATNRLLHEDGDVIAGVSDTNRTDIGSKILYEDNDNIGGENGT